MAEYIEREALKEHLRSYAGMFTDEMGFVVRLDAVLNGIDFQPAADVVERNAFNRLMERYKKATGRMPNGVMRQMVEVKRGRWIWDDNAMDWGLGGWVCSECQEKNDNIPAKPDINPYGWVGSFYCPNCGCLMGGD